MHAVFGKLTFWWWNLHLFYYAVFAVRQHMHQSHNSEIRFKKIPNIVEMESSPLFFSIQDFFWGTFHWICDNKFWFVCSKDSSNDLIRIYLVRFRHSFKTLHFILHFVQSSNQSVKNSSAFLMLSQFLTESNLFFFSLHK